MKRDTTVRQGLAHQQQITTRLLKQGLIQEHLLSKLILAVVYVCVTTYTRRV